MKTAIAFLAGLAAITQTNAFTTTSPLSVGKALPRLTEQTSASPFVQPAAPFQPAPLQKKEVNAVDRSSIILQNALREFANWNDDWDVGGYGMGMGGYGRGVYRRGMGG